MPTVQNINLEKTDVKLIQFSFVPTDCSPVFKNQKSEEGQLSSYRSSDTAAKPFSFCV